MNIVNEYPTDHYENLFEHISSEGFSYDSRTYLQQEIDILQPRLEALGYTSITWLPGESDSWGPLTRVCMATKDHELVWFVYG